MGISLFGYLKTARKQTALFIGWLLWLSLVAIVMGLSSIIKTETKPITRLTIWNG